MHRYSRAKRRTCSRDRIFGARVVRTSRILIYTYIYHNTRVYRKIQKWRTLQPFRSVSKEKRYDFQISRFAVTTSSVLRKTNKTLPKTILYVIGLYYHRQIRIRLSGWNTNNYQSPGIYIHAPILAMPRILFLLHQTRRKRSLAWCAFYFSSVFFLLILFFVLFFPLR